MYTLHDAHNSWDEKIADIKTSADCLCADFCIPLPLSRFALLYFGGLGHHTATFTCIVFHGVQPDTVFTSRTFDVSFRCLIAGYPPSSKSRHCFFLLSGPAECICFFQLCCECEGRLSASAYSFLCVMGMARALPLPYPWFPFIESASSLLGRRDG